MDTLDPALASAIQRYIDGESLQTLAAEAGVSRIAMRARIMRHCLTYTGQSYDSLITDLLAARVAEADARLDDADDAVSIARAREQARFARMDLERRRPALYGQKQELSYKDPPVVVHLNPSPQVIEKPTKLISNTPIEGVIPIESPEKE